MSHTSHLVGGPCSRRWKTLAFLCSGSVALALPIAPAVASSSSPAQSPVADIWAVNDGEKVERDDLDNVNKESNSAWDGSTVNIFGARNEIVAFQLVVEAGGTGIDELTASLPELRRHGGPESAIITYQPPGSDPTEYIDRPIQVFSENYMNVTERSSAGWIYRRGTPSEPADPLGWKPVQLVPENALPGMGGFPLSVPPRNNQALWFDVYIAPDLPAGSYLGQISVIADGFEHNIPIELTVLGFVLPHENSLDAMLYYEGSQVQRYQGRNLNSQYHRFAKRNRVEFVHAYNINSATQAIGRFTGEDFTAENGYEGPGYGVGNRLIPRSFYSPGGDFDTPEEAFVNAPIWTDWLSANLPDKKTFLYMPDEPPTSQYPYIQSLARAVRDSGAPLPIFVTRGYNEALDTPDRLIDIWGVTANNYNIARAEQLRDEGRDMWPYNGQRPMIGSVLIDSPATDPRVTMWAAFKHDVTTYFYWHVNHWRHNSSANESWERDQNIWAEPRTFFNRGGSFAMGDGVVVYPGEEVLHPEHDRGIAGPISTIQLANMRRGLQDHLYLTMAEQLGLTDVVDAALDEIVPRVFSDTSFDQAVSFPENGDAFEEVRLRLGRSIEAASVPECDLVVSGSHSGPLAVDSGVTCLETGATVTGPVTVEAGAALVADGAKITGPINAKGAELIWLCNTNVKGPVNLKAGYSVTVGDPAAGCAPNTITGPVTATDTIGPSVISGNSITGPLSCTGNSPPPVNNGTANTVAGPKIGQCAAL